jgi:hypothetical protein
MEEKVRRDYEEERSAALYSSDAKTLLRKRRPALLERVVGLAVSPRQQRCGSHTSGGS